VRMLCKLRLAEGAKKRPLAMKRPFQQNNGL
jgi:hypothetical protein